jgi:hypothetical protein
MDAVFSSSKTLNEEAYGELIRARLLGGQYMSRELILHKGLESME